MKSPLPSRLSLASVLLLASVTSAQVAINDVFDRPNGTNLGPDWIEVQSSANAVIDNNQFRAANGLFGWALHTTYDAPYASTVARFHWAMEGVIAGDSLSLIVGAKATPTSWEGIQVKICDHQGFDDKADRVLFYAAPNAGNWPGGGNVYNLATPMKSGIMTVWFTNSGDTVHVELIDDATGNIETASATGILSFSFPITGRSVGIGYFGNGYVDDFQAWTGLPTDAPFTFTPPRVGLPASYLVTGATPNSVVGMFISLTGAGPLPTPVGLLKLSLPVYALAAVPTDANGRAELPVGAIPPFSGLPLYLQAIDGTTFTLTNGFVATIL